MHRQGPFISTLLTFHQKCHVYLTAFSGIGFYQQTVYCPRLKYYKYVMCIITGLYRIRTLQTSRAMLYSNNIKFTTDIFHCRLST